VIRLKELHPSQFTVSGNGDAKMNWRDHMTADPSVCHGQACIKGTRVMASVILDNLAAGVSHEQTLVSYPSISAEDIQAVIGYAAELARELVIHLPAGNPA
jgi:uncharacterized protein (DUF433 family)